MKLIGYSGRFPAQITKNYILEINLIQKKTGEFLSLISRLYCYIPRIIPKVLCDVTKNLSGDAMFPLVLHFQHEIISISPKIHREKITIILSEFKQQTCYLLGDSKNNNMIN